MNRRKQQHNPCRRTTICGYPLLPLLLGGCREALQPLDPGRTCRAARGLAMSGWDNLLPVKGLLAVYLASKT